METIWVRRSLCGRTAASSSLYGQGQGLEDYWNSTLDIHGGMSGWVPDMSSVARGIVRETSMAAEGVDKVPIRAVAGGSVGSFGSGSSSSSSGSNSSWQGRFVDGWYVG
jgi:hypothetical protein